MNTWATADTNSPAVAIYSQTCIARHGVNGKGAFLGVADLTKGDGALSKPNEVLLKNVDPPICVLIGG
jgi:hypothetical protein